MQVVDAELHHVLQVVHGDVRQVDIDEWVLGSGLQFDHVLTKRLGLETQYVRALLDDGGVCICLWGVYPEAGYGAVWLIGTTEAEEIGNRIHRLWPEEVGRMHMRHPTLRALAYSGNALHLRWLGQIGFTHEADYLIGPGRIPFTLFVRQAPCAHH